MLKNRKSDFFSVDDYEELYFHYVNFYVDFRPLPEEQLKKGGGILKAAIAQYPDAEILQLLQIYHSFKEKRISKNMLITKLEKIPFPKYEQEHFIHTLAHIYKQIGGKKKAFSLFSALLEKADTEEDKVALYYEILFLYEAAEQAHLAVECCNNILKIGEISHEVLFGDMYEYFFLKTIAIPAFELLTQQYTFSMYAWIYLGKSYADVLMYEDAIQALNYAVAMSNHPVPLIVLGRIFMEISKVTEAFECFQEAVSLDPNITGLYTEMGELLYVMEQPEQAMYSFSLALDADKNDMNAMLGMALALSAVERYDDSIAYIMRAKNIEGLEDLPVEALLLLADNYIETNRDDQALEIFQQLTKQHPKDVDVWLSYSNYYAIIEDFSQACAVLNQGLFLLPDNAPLLYRMANYYFLRGDSKLAVPYLRLAFTYEPDFLNMFLEYDDDLAKNPQVMNIVDNLKPLKSLQHVTRYFFCRELHELA
jgi:tetratricopeptide (TPR) repeat protein